VLDNDSLLACSAYVCSCSRKSSSAVSGVDPTDVAGVTASSSCIAATVAGELLRDGKSELYIWLLTCNDSSTEGKIVSYSL
jgi:hypothetical protein